MSIYIWLPANLNQAFLEINIPVLCLNEVQQVLMREKTNLYCKYNQYPRSALGRNDNKYCEIDRNLAPNGLASLM